jgi:hypothetical protein
MDESAAEEKKPAFPWPMVAGLGVVVVLVNLLYFLGSPESRPEPTQPLPFGSAEEAYAKRIRFVDIKLSRAENFLGQEVTFIVGVAENAGTQDVREIEMVMEFRDLQNQVIYSERQRLFGRNVRPLPSGHSREFQIALERVPAGWNQHAPTFRITGLLLEP